MVQECTQDTRNPLDKGIFTLFEAVFIFCNFKILYDNQMQILTFYLSTQS